MLKSIQVLYMRYLCENKRFFIYSKKKTSILFTKLSPRLHQGRHFNLHKLPFEITILLSLFIGFLFHFHWKTSSNVMECTKFKFSINQIYKKYVDWIETALKCYLQGKVIDIQILQHLKMFFFSCYIFYIYVYQLAGGLLCEKIIND